MEKPLYQSLARDLRQAIAARVYPRGALLPTEEELCAKHGISRHTAREALRLLSQEGLIERRRGAGSIVAGKAPSRSFTQSVGGVPELLQYARDAKLIIHSFSPGEPSNREREELDLASAKWIRITGVRGDPAAPIALSTIYVRASLCPPRGEIEAWSGAINELIEKRSGVRVSRIEQRITAAKLTAAESKSLGVTSGTAALRTVRQYVGPGSVFQASVSLHPAGRFIYAMTLERARKR
jgi:DNA-binding GntR family transcriptional regulator